MGRTRGNTDVFDTVVVGGGPAGLSAAVTLGRAHRTVLVVDDGTPRNAPAEHAHAYLTREPGQAPGSTPTSSRPRPPPRSPPARPEPGVTR
ncbi:FAD-dependent oxidoreductase [Nocardiopsis salina]|uniref:FAD-dependent oxidoreductase n=1 Tax=Nocardiopsis salina TaxID=245836 RepID=UPI0003466704